MEGKGLFFTQWSNLHLCKSDGFWKRGQKELVIWSVDHMHPFSKQAILLLWWRFSIIQWLIKQKNNDLTWEHRGQCFLTGFTGCRTSFPPRRAAQCVKAFHLWGTHLRAQSRSRGCIPWGCSQASQTHPVVQHHQQLHLRRKSQQNRPECCVPGMSCASTAAERILQRPSVSAQGLVTLFF